MQKWLPINYSFVCIENSLTTFVWDNNALQFLSQKTRLVRLF